MSGAAGWAALAGAAGFIGNKIQSDDAFEKKKQLYLLEQDAQEKREAFLAGIRSDLTTGRQQAHDDRVQTRGQTLEAIKAGEYTNVHPDPETGNLIGTNKNGDSKILNATSDDYQSFKKRIESGKADAADLSGEKTQSQIDRAGAQIANYGSEIDKRDSSDPAGDKIRADYQRQINLRRAQNIKDAATAQKTGAPGPGAFDENAVAPDVTAQLYSVYGADAVKGALGGANNVPRSQRVNAAPPAQSAPQQSPTQSGAPSMDQIMAQANAAVKAGADPKAVEARMQQIMQKFGYQPEVAQQQ